MENKSNHLIDNKGVVSVTAITEIFGEGQKCTAVAIEYKEKIEDKSLKISDFVVEGRTITKVYTSDVKVSKKHQINGHYVILELDSSGSNGSTREMIGHGPHGKSAFHRAVIKVYQKGDIRTTTGEIVAASEDWFISDRAIDALADLFREFTFEIPGTDRKLNYQLFIPEEYDPSEKYPLVLFMHDAGSCADETIGPLAQGNGAVIWTTENEQEKHKCFVLAPCYPTVCANDDFEVTPEAKYTVALVKDIMEKYPIDKKRVYGTGQSMGCMMLCEMNIKYPDLFSACLLIAGQWNPKTMAACKDKNLWILVSHGDKKAFPIMGACMESIETAGGKVTRGALNAKASEEALRVEIEKFETAGNHIHFTWFEGESIIPEGVIESNPGMHHVLTWTRAYNIGALRDWLFKQ